jgi:glyoxylase-like metal-dependent hydrolase (beta-lactamase superfamily II)
MELSIECVVSPPFEENSYVISIPGRDEAIVVDPGFDPAAIFRLLDRRKLRVVAILNTHGHLDHIAGNGAMKEHCPDAPLVIGKGEAAMLTDPVLNLSSKYGMRLISPPADQLVLEGESLELLGVPWLVREIPGHSPGHVAFVAASVVPPVVLGGDILFQGGIGRFDTPGGDGPGLIRGIREKLYDLPDETIVYPGHGPATTIGREKRTNPYTNGLIPIG